VLEAAFILLEFPSPSRRIFIGSHSLPPLWFAVSVLQPVKTKKMTKPEDKPVPKMVRKWVPKIATPAKSIDPK
jgi:hypothetical protein